MGRLRFVQNETPQLRSRQHHEFRMHVAIRCDRVRGEAKFAAFARPVRIVDDPTRRVNYARQRLYCSSLTFSIQSTTFPSNFP